MYEVCLNKILSFFFIVNAFRTKQVFISNDHWAGKFCLFFAFNQNLVLYDIGDRLKIPTVYKAIGNGETWGK